MNRKPASAVKIHKDAKHSLTPDASEWDEYESLKPGYFWVCEDQIESVRGAWLKHQRYVKVLLKDASRSRSLHYTFNKNDSHKGVCTVHAMPQHYGEIQAWLRKLGLSIPYLGQDSRL